MRDSTKWLLAMFAAIAFAGGVAVVVLALQEEYRWHKIGTVLSDGKSPEERTQAKRYALQALRRHGIRSLAKECSAVYDDGFWLVSGKAINRDNRISEVSVFFRVATADGVVRWELVSGEVDGMTFGP